MIYHLPAPSSAYMVTFLCLILQTTRPTTSQQKEDLMHTPSKIKVSSYTTHTDSTSHGGGRLINFSSLQKIVAVKPMGQSQARRNHFNVGGAKSESS